MEATSSFILLKLNHDLLNENHVVLKTFSLFLFLQEKNFPAEMFILQKKKNSSQMDQKIHLKKIFSSKNKQKKFLM